MKIYIAGKISGLDPEMAINKFNDALNRIISMGHEPVSPYGRGSYDWSWEKNMRVALRLLLGCDGIYMINNWRDSRGAVIEHDLAIAIGMKVMYHENEKVTW